ncbi:hypothetical protein NIES4071_109740 (plasmid) [Calothrix sp. NIES-4071]|nr:hypothetical protein NIES4071_109740 [Calothrix sp. NIES-4071]
MKNKKLQEQIQSNPEFRRIALEMINQQFREWMMEDLGMEMANQAPQINETRLKELLTEATDSRKSQI